MRQSDSHYTWIYNISIKIQLQRCLYSRFTTTPQPQTIGKTTEPPHQSELLSLKKFRVWNLTTAIPFPISKNSRGTAAGEQRGAVVLICLISSFHKRAWNEAECNRQCIPPNMHLVWPWNTRVSGPKYTTQQNGLSDSPYRKLHVTIIHSCLF